MGDKAYMAQKRIEVCSNIWKAQMSKVKFFDVHTSGTEDPVAMLIDNFTNQVIVKN